MIEYEEELGRYEELIVEGSDIVDLLHADSGNVGDIGELLVLAAQEIEKLRSLQFSQTTLMQLRDVAEYLHVEEYNNEARLFALEQYFKFYDSTVGAA